MTEITKEQLVELLNKDLGLEYTACVQYTQHQAVLKSAMYQSIQKELIIHAQEELAHATILADQIDYLGGVPTVEMPLPAVSPDNVEMLERTWPARTTRLRATSRASSRRRRSTCTTSLSSYEASSRSSRSTRWISSRRWASRSIGKSIQVGAVTIPVEAQRTR